MHPSHIKLLLKRVKKKIGKQQLEVTPSNLKYRRNVRCIYSKFGPSTFDLLLEYEGVKQIKTTNTIIKQNHPDK